MNLVPLLLSLSLAPTPSAEPETPDAYALGAAAFAAGDHEAAAEHFEAAYTADASTATLYNWAQALRLSDRCEDATEIYERFVAEGSLQPDAGIAPETWEAMRAHASEQIEACPRAAAPPPPEVVTPVDPPLPALSPTAEGPVSAPGPEFASAPAPASVVDAPPRRRPDALGVSLLATGSALAATGAGLFIAAELVADNAADEFLHQNQRDGLQRAASLQLAGAITLPVGAALAIGGAVRLGVVARRKRTLALSLRPWGNGVALWGRF